MAAYGSSPGPGGASGLLLRGAAALLVWAGVAGCGGGNQVDEGGPIREGTMERAGIQRVLEERTPGWMELPGVTGTGIGRCDGVPCIKVFVERVTPELEEALPSEVDGHPVRVEPTGRFEAGGDSAGSG